MCEEYDREDCCDGTSGSHFFFPFESFCVISFVHPLSCRR